MNFLPKSHIFAAKRGNPDSKIGTLKTFFAKSNPCDCNIGTFDASSSTFDGKSSLFAGKLGLYQDEKGVSSGPPQTTCSCFGVSNSHRGEGGWMRTTYQFNQVSEQMQRCSKSSQFHMLWAHLFIGGPPWVDPDKSGHSATAITLFLVSPVSPGSLWTLISLKETIGKSSEILGHHFGSLGVLEAPGLLQTL